MGDLRVAAAVVAGMRAMVRSLQCDRARPDGGSPCGRCGHLAARAHSAVGIGVAAASLTAVGTSVALGHRFAIVAIVGGATLAATRLAPAAGDVVLGAGGLAAALVHVAVIDGMTAAAEVALAAGVLLAGLRWRRARLARHEPAAS